MHKLILAFLLTSPSLFASVELPEVVVTPCSGNEGKIINIGGKSRYCPINTTGSAGGSGSSHVDASGGGSAGYGGMLFCNHDSDHCDESWKFAGCFCKNF